MLIICLLFQRNIKHFSNWTFNYLMLCSVFIALTKLPSFALFIVTIEVWGNDAIKIFAHDYLRSLPKISNIQKTCISDNDVDIKRFKRMEPSTSDDNPWTKRTFCTRQTSWMLEHIQVLACDLFNVSPLK